jgi:hypothetical protein
MPPHRRTAAVTVAGTLLLVPAVASALMTVLFATGGHMQSAPLSGINLVATVIFGYAGPASICRWRGWRIWAGVAAWCLIAFVVLKLFAPPPPPGTDRSFDMLIDLIVVALAVFVLIAKRLERRPDLAAVFR